MHEDRFPFSQSAYEQQDIEAQFRLYEGVGHRLPQVRDLIEFHRRTLAGEDVSDFGADVASGAAGPVVTEGPTADVAISTEDVVVGDSVSFDASESQRGDTVITTYSWDFDDGTTATGESVTHSFDESGDYTVELTVEDFYGETATVERELTVAEPATPTPTQTPMPDAAMTPTSEASGGAGGDTPTETESSSGGDETPGENGPGFGVGTAVTALGSGAYVLARRLAASEE
jgi:PGF-CTERM protein